MLEVRKAAGEDEDVIFRLIRELADTVGFAEQAPLIDLGIWSKTLKRMLESASIYWRICPICGSLRFAGLMKDWYLVMLN